MCGGCRSHPDFALQGFDTISARGVSPVGLLTAVIQPEGVGGPSVEPLLPLAVCPAEVEDEVVGHGNHVAVMCQSVSQSDSE